jgi:DNA-directed RNA polymerase specialized sigma24 family protein
VVPLEPDVRDALEAVGDDGWKAIISRLVHYALLRTHRLRWKTPTGTLAQGKEAADLAMEAIAQVWQGERAWDPETQPDLLHFLEGIVDSRLSHLVASPDHQKRQLATVATGEGGEQDPLAGLPDPDPTPEGALVEAEDVRRAQEQAAQVRQAVQGEEDLELVLLGIEEGQKPMEIANDLGLSRDEVYQLIRKIKRRVDGVMKRAPSKRV